LQLLSPTEAFCSKSIVAENYFRDIDAHFQLRKEREHDLDERTSFKEMRTSDFDSDFKSFTSDLFTDGTPQSMLNPIKGLNLLHSHDPSKFCISLSTLVRQVEKEVRFLLSFY
jgi:hypothetical protein